MTEFKNKGAKKYRCWQVIVGAVLTLVMICTGVLIAAYQRCISLPAPIQEKLDLMPDVNALAGTMPAGGDGIGSENSFQVVINQLLTMENGSSPCNLQTENPVDNIYDLRVSLYLKDTGELLGATHRIQQGKRVDTLKLDRTLPAGEYEIQALLELFDDQQEPVTQLSVDLSLLVKQ